MFIDELCLVMSKLSQGMTIFIIYIYIPGSSKCVKCVPFHQKNLPKGRFFTYLEDPGIYIYITHKKKEQIVGG